MWCLNSTHLRFVFIITIVFQSLSYVQLFVTSWTVACCAPLSFTISQSLLTLISIELVMLSNHPILCHPLLLPSTFPSIRVFSLKSALCIRWQSIGAPASASVLPVNIQSWFPFRLTGLISLLLKGLSRVFSRTATRNHQFLHTHTHYIFFIHSSVDGH